MQKGVERGNNVPRNYLNCQKYLGKSFKISYITKNVVSNKEQILIRLKSYEISTYFASIFCLNTALGLSENLNPDRNVLKDSPCSQKVKYSLHLWWCGWSN